MTSANGGPDPYKLNPIGFEIEKKDRNGNPILIRARQIRPPDTKDWNMAGEEVITGLNSEKRTMNEGSVSHGV